MAEEEHPPQQSGFKRWLRSLSLVLALLLLLGGGYILWTLRAPSIQPLNSEQQKSFTPEVIGDQQILIPKIALKVAVNAGDQSVLNKGAWHRFPELGDPDRGGNFIVSGHRFVFSRTPQHTKELSYFYNIDKLVVGDEILVDWQQKRHRYVVSQIFTVAPTQTDIEAPSDTTKLTLYTCTLGGSADGRVVIIAQPR